MANLLNENIIIAVIGIMIFLMLLYVLIVSIQGRKTSALEKQSNEKKNRVNTNQDYEYHNLLLNKQEIEKENYNLREDIRELKNKNSFLREEINELREKLKYKDSGIADLERKKEKYTISNKGSNTESLSKNLTIDNNRREEQFTRKNYNVQYDLRKKNGDLILVSDSDMFLENDSDYYKLKHKNSLQIEEPADLLNIERSYEITNPDNENSKPMRIISEPRYIFDEEAKQAILKIKGEIEFT